MKDPIVFINELRARSERNELHSVVLRVYQVWMVLSLTAAYAGVYCIATGATSAFTATIFLSIALVGTVVGFTGKYIANLIFELDDDPTDSPDASSSVDEQ